MAIIVATIPALLAGALLGDFIKSVLYESPSVFAATFILGGLVMLGRRARAGPSPVVQDAERTPVSRAFGIGLCQMLALIPGVSRSGATIVGGMAMGLDRPAAAEFSFFLAMPTMTAAFASRAVRGPASALVRIALSRSASVSCAAFLASLVVITPFLMFVRRSGFAPFAWYRIGLGLAMFAAIAAGWL